jgi:hypothetical protein
MITIIVSLSLLIILAFIKPLSEFFWGAATMSVILIQPITLFGEIMKWITLCYCMLMGILIYLGNKNGNTKSSTN